MAMDEVKDSLKDQVVALAARVQESAAWNELMERYHDLNPRAQKAALFGVGFLFALLLFLVPWTFYSASQDDLAAFEDKKQLLRELFRSNRAASQLPPTPPGISSSELRNSITSALESERPGLLPEQTVSIDEFENDKASDLPKGLTKKGFLVNLSRLNVDQIVKYGERLQTIRPAVKLVGVKIQATAADPHFFDVTYRVVGFALPPEKAPATKPGTKPSAPKPAAPADDEG